MNSRKVKLTRNSKSLKRFVTDLTEVKRPNGKQKHIAHDCTREKFKTLPKNFKNLKITTGTPYEGACCQDRSNTIQFASNMEREFCDTNSRTETVSIQEKLQKMDEHTTEIIKKMEDFSDTLSRKKLHSQKNEELVSMSSLSKSTFSKVIQDTENLKHYIASIEDADTCDDIFGFNTFEEDEDNNYFIEAYNKLGDELVISTLEITRRTIKPNELNDGIKILIDNSDFVVHKNEYGIKNSSSESDTYEIVDIEDIRHNLVAEDDVFYAEVLHEPQPLSSYNNNNIKREMVENGETTNNFYQNVPHIYQNLFVCEEIVRDEIDAISHTPFLVKKERIHYIIEEMKKTEELYISGLQNIVEKYIPYLYEHTPQDLIGRTAYLFGNIEDIYKNAKSFLNLMRQINDDNVDNIAQIFIKKASDFEVYPLYSKNKPTADIYLKQFDAVVKERQKQLNDKLGLASYLLTPIQRLGKYVLLLEGVQKELKKTKKSSDNITSAIEVVRHVMRKGNDYIAIDSIKDSKVDLTTKGSFIMRALFNILRPRKFTSMVFLFENIVVFTEKVTRNVEQFKYLESIPMSDLSLGKFEEKPNIFHLTNYTKSKRAHPDATYVLEAENPKVKIEWTEVIGKILWSQLEKVKEQQKKIRFTDTKHLPKASRSSLSEQKTSTRKTNRTIQKPQSTFYDS